MGLSQTKRKQKLVGSAITRNVSWSNDSSLPGQRLLSSMGWTAGQSIGKGKDGLTEAVRVAIKLDNRGIGAQRAEKEARASGKADAWIGGGGELGDLFSRLNRASETPPVTDVENEEVQKPKKGKSKEKKSRKEEKKKANGEQVESLVSPAAAFNPRMASRARFLKAKRMVGSDSASINEILGISSPASSGMSTPAAATTPPLTHDQGADTDEPSETSLISGSKVSKKRKSNPTSSELEKTKKKRKKKDERSSDEEGSSKRSKRSRKSKSVDEDERHEKKLKKAEKKIKASLSTIEQSKPREAASDPSFLAGGGHHVSKLSVQEYLNNKLMLRRANILRAKRDGEDSLWKRAATVGA